MRKRKFIKFLSPSFFSSLIDYTILLSLLNYSYFFFQYTSMVMCLWCKSCFYILLSSTSQGCDDIFVSFPPAMISSVNSPQVSKSCVGVRTSWMCMRWAEIKSTNTIITFRAADLYVKTQMLTAVRELVCFKLLWSRMQITFWSSHLVVLAHYGKHTSFKWNSAHRAKCDRPKLCANY